MNIKKLFLTFWFLLFTAVVFAQGLDLNLLKAINGPVNTTADRNWKYFTRKAIFIDASVPASLLIAGFINHDNELKADGLQAASAIIIAGGTNLLVKKIVNRPRPFVTHPDVIIPKDHPTDSSFPSGHTSAAFAAATSLSLAIPKWYVIAPSFAYAGAVGYSRMYLGVHYPSDVLAGAALGVGSAYLTYKAQQWIMGKKKKHEGY
ncbi:undecaprenyl-diphosphatase [Mucilaginibacter pineti]|uniref:Undecaprenyl-diphosphatase n=1 Tax=Mucilaginibacter pineti TaxID=1391627 RepID=A0A1G6WFT2_9SPHI|nr:phosphatase PAP2 family protein [Mucilaginibacter pineti]SDD64691.1 undecaprenyl-diphosphatase [Mucilaginibacter pineti]